MWTSKRLVELRQRAHRRHRQHPRHRHDRLPVRHRQHVRPATERERRPVPQRIHRRHGVVGARLGRRLRRDRRQPIPEHRPRGRRPHGRLLGRYVRRRCVVEHREDIQERHLQLPLHPVQRGPARPDPGRYGLSEPGARRLVLVPGHRHGQRLAAGQRRHRPVHLPQQRQRRLVVQPGCAARRAHRTAPRHPGRPTPHRRPADSRRRHHFLVPEHRRRHPARSVRGGTSGAGPTHRG